MASYQYIEKETVNDILKSYNFTDEDVEEIYQDTNSSFVQYTTKMCNLYLKYLDIGTDSADKAAYSLGAVIIFNLRKFVTKKDIIMYIGGTDAENNNLKVLEKPITEFINDPSTFKITNSALELYSAIEKYENLNKTINQRQSAVWKKILDASQAKGSGDFITHNGADATIPLAKKDRYGKDYRNLYQRIIIDTDVYYGFNGKNLYSYYKMEDYFQFFNRGWLFEHFTNKWMHASAEGKAMIVDQVNSEHPLAGIVGKTDNVPGYQGGDVQYRGRDYQMKYGNQQIITKTSIKKCMNIIIKSLNEFENNKKRAKTILSRNLVELFTKEGNVNLTKVNDTYDKVVDKMVNSLVRRI